MNWTCTHTEERLMDYLDGALSSAETAEWNAHAATCLSCSRLIAQVGGLVTQMHRIPLIVEPVGLAEKVMDATLGPRAPKRARAGWLSLIPSFWEPRFVMGMVTVAASLLIVLHATSAKTGKPSLNPANIFHVANRQVHLTYARSTKFVNDLRVVYEIQSKLTPPPESISEPAPTPNSQPQPKDPQPNDPREKSQATPHRSHRETRSDLQLAQLLAGGTPASGWFSDFALRRLL
jgi:Putative zinc-finger